MIKDPNAINQQRRRFLGGAVITVAAARFGMFGSADAAPETSQPPTTAAGKPGTHTSFASMKQAQTSLLDVGYAEAGKPDGPVVILLHGWPYDIHSYVDVTPLLASMGYRVIVPYVRGYGTTRFRSGETVRNAQQSAVALDTIDLMDALKIDKAILGGFDWGARTADIVAALRPDRCTGIVSVSGYLISSPKQNQKPLPPAAELGWWYQYYFATDRGRVGYGENRRDFNKLIWKNVSPKWAFDDATFDRTAAAFDNPDHVDIVIHNYRWRLGLAQGEPRYDDLERKLAEGPVISVPAVTVASDFDGANADGAAYRNKFSGAYAHRVFKGIGHNVPQEAPRAFADAIVEVDRISRRNASAVGIGGAKY
jgi:pimeloyl-ACP methyl ester carboxylesterase